MRAAFLLFLATLPGCDKHDHDDHGDETDTTDTTDTTDDTDPAEPTATAFSLDFVATLNGAEVGCGDTLTGLGPTGIHTVGINDLRFYVSNLVFRDEADEIVPITLDENDFQYSGDAGWVALIDLTTNAGGDCEPGAISFSEGTARTHTGVTGTTLVERVRSVSFDVGIPQGLMKEVIATNTVEGAPSPLAEMYWSWASGYRHFVVNLTTSDGTTDGEGYLHIGSTGCAGDGELALETKASCDRVNTPQVALASFDLATQQVAVDMGAVFEGMDFVAPVYDPVTYEVIGESVGVECHASPMQPDCAAMFSNFGLDLTSGAADPASNTIFIAQ
jgi:uncharacterized repeat protein (TIGR04052 family)